MIFDEMSIKFNDSELIPDRVNAKFCSTTNSLIIEIPMENIIHIFVLYNKLKGKITY